MNFINDCYIHTKNEYTQICNQAIRWQQLIWAHRHEVQREWLEKEIKCIDVRGE